jgi:transcriptional regulator with XRE-family HTH domain
VALGVLWTIGCADRRVGAVPSSGSPEWKAENLEIAREFGAKVRAARAAAGLSQERLAVRARVHRTEVGAVERGKHLPSLSTVLIFADALSVDAATLVAGLPTPQHRRTIAYPGESRDSPVRSDRDEPVEEHRRSWLPRLRE